MDSKGLNTTIQEAHDAEKGSMVSELSTTLNVYRDKHHILLTPCTHPRKEKAFPTWRGIDKFDVNSNLGIRAPQSFFLQQPILSFHAPPHLLRRGHTKSSQAQLPPVCLIHNSSFWNSWKIQIGPSLATEGVIDPRGVVCAEHTGDHVNNEKALKGYGVRSWRMWGESGKKYHRLVNSQRKDTQKTDMKSVEEQKVESAESRTPVEADEVIHLRWVSPLSTSTRLYTFTWQGVSFSWKGTSTVRETRRLGSLLRYAHLKLMAQLPDDDPHACHPVEVCLATYTCSIAPEKAGKLDLFDAQIRKLALDHAPGAVVDLRDVVVATAMCMVMGEFEKRVLARELAFLIMTAGNVN
ncbi:hypothetical protein EJ05DRAFT_137677 [Pseudovirgaria hyperparasitica]|uniref:Uncharacterized protein n=1 Tax=Pseudovirgaria hyperparasitica TaxID=470096 RepID=A0A6A6VXK2_9PEZI|nr:uncharacterized protein EJ05DRAFT_137677 [Pseudovirgaria hyperparasitica]KAF2754905.1 hypothetical protein EJ05DRAFT_137677 [Pseudovirgaria hyperparasitica]